MTVVLLTGITQTYVDYLVLLAVTVIAMALGLFIAFQAYRGYRRNASRRMLLLAVGLTLLTVVPFAVSIVAASIGHQLGFGSRVYTYYLPITSRLIEIGGLGCILYSLSIRE